MILPFYLEGVFADHAGQEGVIRASGLDWTLARPPSLKDADAAGPEALFAGVDADGQAPIRMAISRQDVASFLLSSAVDGSFRQAAPVVAVRR